MTELQADRWMLARYREARMTVVNQGNECSKTNNDFFIRQTWYVRHQCIVLLLERSGTRRSEWTGVEFAYRSCGGLNIRSPIGVAQHSCRQAGTVCCRASEGKNTYQ